MGRSQVNVTTVLSGDEVGIIHNGFSIEIIQLLTEKENYVRGCTVPLYTMETAIKKNDNVQKHLPETYKAGKGIFVITTDGLETSSKNYTYEQIRKMISAKKECGWEFLFPGANIDAEKEAEKIGIAHKLSVTYENDPEGVAINFKV
ncbi:MAG: hypothetical protein PUI16_04120, partial [Clostridia bacterium]|nr:hypothetical protein [Clostridia bacterium]MDY5553829.1 hypothetical protein [Blautia sp.]